MLILLPLLLQASGPVAPAVDDTPEDVVVVSRRGRCDLSIANRIISDREFRAKTREWAANRAVRVRVPVGSTIRCEAKIMFRLGRYGVTRATFVEE